MARPEPYRELLDLLPDIAFRASADGEVLYVNGRFEELSGIPANEAPARWRDVFPDGAAFNLASTYAWVAKQPGRDGVFETIFVVADGSERTAEVHCRIVETSNGHEMIGIARDRTEDIALRRHTQANEFLFRTLAEAAPVAIFRADPQGNITYLNKAWADRLGTPVEELLGTGWTKHVVDPQVYANDPPWQGFTPQNDLRIRTNRFWTTQGEVLEFQTLNRAEFASDGTLLGFVGVMFDITEQARAWRAYEALEAQHSTLIELAPVGIFQTDADGALEYANEIWCRITGLTLDDAKGDGWARAVHPDDLDRVLAVWAEARASGEGQARFRFRHEDGTDVTVDVATSALRTETGEVSGFAGAVLDVTREEEALVAAHQGQEQLARLAAQSRDAIFRLDLEGRCLYASPAAATLLDTPTDELIGQSMLVHHHPEDEEKFFSIFKALVDGSASTAELEYRARSPRPPHAYHWLEVHGRLVRDSFGQPSELVVSLRDISVRKQLELDLLKARDDAEAATVAKSAFLANMSHEIRTPMNGVLGFVELLADSALDATQRQQVELIRESGQAMMRLLNDILDLSKVEAGRLSLSDEDVDLRHLLRGVLALNQPAANLKHLALHCEIDGELPTCIRGDALRIRQIVGNLLGNAVKFTESGTITLSTRLLGNSIVIEVRDTGIGLPADQLEQVFEEFSQADTTIHRRFGGTGLGLPISRNLAELMGGSLLLENADGGGTVARLTLPLVLASPRPAADPPREAKHVIGARSSLARILVAEDHPVNQALISAMLDQLGYEYDIATDGEAAELMACSAHRSARPYDLVLMDIEMPKRDGIAVAERIRNRGIPASELPIVALTANAFAEDTDRYLAAGMQAHLVKPLELDSLSEIVEHWSDKSRAAREKGAA